MLVVFSAAGAFLHSGVAEDFPGQPRPCIAAVNLCRFGGVQPWRAAAGMIKASRAAEVGGNIVCRAVGHTVPGLAVGPVCSVQGTAAVCALQTSSHLAASTHLLFNNVYPPRRAGTVGLGFCPRPVFTLFFV